MRDTGVHRNRAWWLSVVLRTLEEKLDPPHAALLVIDVQNDFCHAGCELARMGADVSATQEAIPRIEQLIAAGRSAGVLVVFVQAVHTNVDISDVYREHRARTLPGAAPIVEDGTWGAQFFIVSPEPDEPVVKKYRYSAFIGTGLDTILRARGIRTLMLAGVTTEGCVESTARDGYMLDYYVVIAGDATAAHVPHEHDAALERMNRMVGVVCPTSAVTDVWARAAATV